MFFQYLKRILSSLQIICPLAHWMVSLKFTPVLLLWIGSLHFLCHVLLQAQVGCSPANLPWCSTTWWRNLLGVWEDCLWLLLTVPLPLNLWAEIHYWIKHMNSTQTLYYWFSSRASAIILLYCWLHSGSMGVISWEIRRQFLLILDRSVFLSSICPHLLSS